MPEYESLFARRARPPPIRLSTSISEVFRPIVREGAVGVGRCRWFGVSERVVVPESAWSYPRGALRYDHGELRTTGSAGSTTAPDYVRPRRITYDHAALRTTARGLWNSAEPMPAPGRTPRADDAARAGALRGYDDERPRPAERRRPGTRRGELAASRKRCRRTTQPRGRHSYPPRDRQPAPRREKTRTTVHIPPTTPPQHEEPAFLNGLRGSSRQRKRYERAWRSMEWGGGECEHKKGAPLENLREPQERYTSAANPHRAIAGTPRDPTTYRTIVRFSARSYLNCPLTYDCADSRTTARGGLRYCFQDHLQRKNPLNYPARLRGHSNG